ncbi:PLP-dependent aminotransferase family protein [Nonomuraea mesophila]|uniref:PLP-dependent aminotransferase family protein n=1 Tax=Nonomuraea mesophila TaxID=2530382 RepID=A0A4R5FJB0_9ACTN|nr:PLP-dependent aminotransferase family protein [Nonomuraea mesophila]
MTAERDHGQAPATHGSRIDAYVDRYAARATGMVASEIRALFAVASRPEVVSLAGGMPYVTALPLDMVGELVSDLVTKRGPVALQYGSGQGDPHLREQICEVMRLEGIHAGANDVVVTVGSQQALDLITRIFIDPGDVVLAEGPSYVGALGTFAAYQAKVVHIAMDDQGIVPESLAQTIYALETAGAPIKFLYTIPTFQNPAGVTLNIARRQQVLDICQRAGVLVIEDNPYGLLGFDGEPMRALRADNPDGVVYLGSFSKTLAPGFRVGWALAPHAIRDKLVLAMESAVLSHSSFTQLAVGQYLTTQPWREQIKTFKELYRERRDAILDALDALMPPEVTWTRPAGGFFVWATLPEGLDSKAILPRAVAERVAFVPGTGFFSDGSGSRHMRLSFCFPEPDRIREGVRRLAGVIEQEMQLRDTFGTSSARDHTGVDTPGPDLA